VVGRRALQQKRDPLGGVRVFRLGALRLAEPAEPDVIARRSPLATVSRTQLPAPHTSSWYAFDQNIGRIGHINSLGGREIALLKAEAIRFHAYLDKPRDLTKKTTAAIFLRTVKRYTSTMRTRIDRSGTATLWQVVMLVTCVEAYVQDLLSVAASLDDTLMAKSEQCAPYADVIAAGSVADLASNLRDRWARGWINDGGPSRWIARLEAMGARGYPPTLGHTLELFWGIRHAIVHRAGVATADFVKRHPGVVKAVGDRLNVRSKGFGDFLRAVTAFVGTTEQFFIARYPLLVVPAPQNP
jgi:hypothetical protein